MLYRQTSSCDDTAVLYSQTSCDDLFFPLYYGHAFHSILGMYASGGYGSISICVAALVDRMFEGVPPDNRI